MALSACSGSGSPANSGGGGPDNGQLGNTGNGQDPKAAGPVTIGGAKSGGTVRVISNDGLNSMDPTEAYYINTGSILTNLVTRSLTQYVYDAKSGDMILVPDLATDLGDHNADYTKWTFTIRDGVKFENGQAGHGGGHRLRHQAVVRPQHVPGGRRRTATTTSSTATATRVRTPARADYKGVTVDGNTLTIKMAKPFPDMPYWGTFPAMGPIPEGEAQRPGEVRLHPWATGPYMFKEYAGPRSR